MDKTSVGSRFATSAWNILGIVNASVNAIANPAKTLQTISGIAKRTLTQHTHSVSPQSLLEESEESSGQASAASSASEAPLVRRKKRESTEVEVHPRSLDSMTSPAVSLVVRSEAIGSPVIASVEPSIPPMEASASSLIRVPSPSARLQSEVEELLHGLVETVAARVDALEMEAAPAPRLANVRLVTGERAIIDETLSHEEQAIDAAHFAVRLEGYQSLFFVGRDSTVDEVAAAVLSLINGKVQPGSSGQEMLVAIINRVIAIRASVAPQAPVYVGLTKNGKTIEILLPLKARDADFRKLAAVIKNNSVFPKSHQYANRVLPTATGWFTREVTVSGATQTQGAYRNCDIKLVAVEAPVVPVAVPAPVSLVTPTVLGEVTAPKPALAISVPVEAPVEAPVLVPQSLIRRDSLPRLVVPVLAEASVVGEAKEADTPSPVPVRERRRIVAPRLNVMVNGRKIGTVPAGTTFAVLTSRPSLGASRGVESLTSRVGKSGFNKF